MNELVLVLELGTLPLDLDHLVEVRHLDWERLGYGDRAHRGGASIRAGLSLASSRPPVRCLEHFIAFRVLCCAKRVRLKLGILVRVI